VCRRTLALEKIFRVSARRLGKLTTISWKKENKENCRLVDSIQPVVIFLSPFSRTPKNDEERENHYKVGAILSMEMLVQKSKDAD
jgi:hypothetical protein